MMSALTFPFIWFTHQLKTILDYTSLSSTATTILLGTVTLLVSTLWFYRHRSDCPPCPILPWPIVGNIFHLEKDPREQLERFREKCGDIFSIYMGTTQVVFISGYDLIKEALVNRADEFSDRAPNYGDVVTHSVNQGLIASNGDAWRQNRTVSLNILKKFGMGKNLLAEKIQEEIDHYLELLQSFKGQPRNVAIYTQMSMSNVTCSILLGRRFEYNDEEFKRLMCLFKEDIESLKMTGPLKWFPFLRYLPGDLFNSKVAVKTFREILKVFANVQRKEDEFSTGEPENYIAAYRQEMQRQKAAHLNESNLFKSLHDLFIAGTETTATTITWFMLIMLHRPEVQDKLFSEIETQIGLTRNPTMHDKPKLPYLLASIWETQRFANIGPLIMPRIISKDTTLGGYTLTKGTHYIINMTSVLHDKSVWGDDADKFRPERFLSKDGKVLNLPEQWIPFSLGKRVCLGEGLAMMELFLILANIVQKFKMLPADENDIPPLKGILGGVNAPQEYQIRLVKRSNVSR